MRRPRDLSRKTFWPPVAELHPALQPIRDSMTRAFRSVLLMLVIPVGMVAIAGVACVELVSSDPLTASEVAAVKAELADRSFRRFEPHVDGDPRKGVILDFFGPLSLWAQYAERGHALNEWEIVADDYRVERAGSGQVMTLYPVAARAVQQLPTECRGCIDVTGVSVSVRNAFDSDRIAFRLNDPDGVLPLPFPVFTQWTEFREDEWQN